MNQRKRQLSAQYSDLARAAFGYEPLVFVSINLDLTAMRRAVQRDKRLVLSDELLTALRYTKREDALGVFYRKLLHRVSRAFYGSAHQRFGKRLKYLGVLENSGKCYNRYESPHDAHFLVSIPTEGHQRFTECLRTAFDRWVYPSSDTTIHAASVTESLAGVAAYPFKQFVCPLLATERLLMPQ
jgi:hypothetical protein